MLETSRYETGRRVRGTLVLTVAVSAYIAFIVWYFTVLEGADFDAVFADMPPAMVEAFGIQALGTIEGFLGGQIFNFVWLLAMGIYFAYAAAGVVANDLEHERLDLLISFPVSRSRLLLEKTSALLLPLITLNVVGPVVIYVLVYAFGETIDPVRLLLAHALSIPYLLVCVALGLLLSIHVDRAAIAERAAMGIVFVFWLVESVVSAGSDIEWLQYLSPTHYYAPTSVLVEGSYEFVHAVVLLAMFVGLMAVAVVSFRRRDL